MDGVLCRNNSFSILHIILRRNRQRVFLLIIVIGSTLLSLFYNLVSKGSVAVDGKRNLGKTGTCDRCGTYRRQNSALIRAAASFRASGSFCTAASSCAAASFRTAGSFRAAGSSCTSGRCFCCLGCGLICRDDLKGEGVSIIRWHLITLCSFYDLLNRNLKLCRIRLINICDGCSHGNGSLPVRFIYLVCCLHLLFTEEGVSICRSTIYTQLFAVHGGCRYFQLAVAILHGDLYLMDGFIIRITRDRMVAFYFLKGVSIRTFFFESDLNGCFRS